jgi:hypothetical protein
LPARPRRLSSWPVGDIGVFVALRVAAGWALQAAIGEVGGEVARGVLRGVGNDARHVVLSQESVDLWSVEAGISQFDGVTDGADPVGGEEWSRLQPLVGLAGERHILIGGAG